MVDLGGLAKQLLDMETNVTEAFVYFTYSEGQEERCFACTGDGAFRDCVRVINSFRNACDTCVLTGRLGTCYLDVVGSLGKLGSNACPHSSSNTRC